MSKNVNSTRRSFLKNGAVLAAPFAAAAAPAIMAEDGLKARVARLEDEAAIRVLHHGWLRRVNAGDRKAVAPLLADTERSAFGQAVRIIAADHTGEPDAIKVAADGRGAIGRFHCAVEIETPIPQDSTLAQMARAQGGGFVRRTERRMLKVEYVKAGGAWAIAKAEFALA